MIFPALVPNEQVPRGKVQGKTLPAEALAPMRKYREAKPMNVLASRMELGVNALKSIAGNMGINLGRGNIGMT